MREDYISVITVCYNAGDTIASCVESVASQTLDLEHIIVDGLSTDGTLDILERYRHLPNFRVFSEKDNGIYDAMNKGLGMAKGDIIGILNADDEYASSDTLEHVTNAMTDPNVDACYGDLVYVDKDHPSEVKRYWRAGSYTTRSFYFGWMPPHPTFFVRKRVYEQYGMFNTSLGSAADYELMLRFLLKHRIKAAYIPKVLTKMRSGGVSNASIASRLKANHFDKMAWRVNGLTHLPGTTIAKPLRKIPQFFLGRSSRGTL